MKQTIRRMFPKSLDGILGQFQKTVTELELFAEAKREQSKRLERKVEYHHNQIRSHVVTQQGLQVEARAALTAADKIRDLISS